MPSPYAFALLHTVLASFAGFLLWRLWQRIGAASTAPARAIIAAGFVARAVVAQALFWISYLRLPIARSLQDGDGFWTFAIDARSYFAYSERLLQQGWQSTILVNKGLPSPVFLQVLALFISLFGAVASVGALLNLFAYLGSCAAILRLGRERQGTTKPTIFALAALSFVPSVVLWSVQPLKDAFFMFGIVAFVAACSQWHETWRAERIPFLRLATHLLLIFAALYAVVGIRWYCGLLLWGASLPFFIFAAFRSHRRTIAAVMNTGVFVAMSQLLVFGAGPYFPPAVVAVLGHPPHGMKIKSVPSEVASVVALSRRGFDSSRANTQIHLGSVLAEADHLATRKPSSTELASKHLSVRKHERRSDSIEHSNREGAEHVDAAIRPEEVLLPAGGMASASASQVAETAVIDGSTLPNTPSIPEASAVPAEAVSRPSVPSAALSAPMIAAEPAQETRATVPMRQLAQPSTVAYKKHRAEGPRPASPPVKADPPRRSAMPPVTGHVTHATTGEEIRKRSPPAVVPQSIVGRLAAGATAIVLPRFIGEAAGLIHVGGGSGLWLVIEIDTLAFDALLLLVIYYVLRGIRAGGALRNPSFWLVLLMTVGIAGLLAYTISNFGTLFRHRAMILVGLCLLVVVAQGSGASRAGIEAEC